MNPKVRDPILVSCFVLPALSSCCTLSHPHPCFFFSFIPAFIPPCRHIRTGKVHFSVFSLEALGRNQVPVNSAVQQHQDFPTALSSLGGSRNSFSSAFSDYLTVVLRDKHCNPKGNFTACGSSFPYSDSEAILCFRYFQTV